MSLVSWLTPWKPATMAMCPSLTAVVMRPGVTSMMRALPWLESVMTPAWLPVNERALAPRFWIAMASSAIEIRSPAVSSMSSSRPGGQRRHLLRQVEQLVGVVAIALHDHDDVAAGLLGGHDPLGHPLDALGVGHRRATVLLHDQAHGPRV
jgi:hypothetical protein